MRNRSAAWWKRILRWGVGAFAALVLGSAAFVGCAFYRSYQILPDERALNAFVPAAATEIYSSDGVLLGRVGPVNRRPARLSKIPQHLQDAVVAIEDQRFYDHAGLDGRGIVRAAFRNLRAGDPRREGASTLTQQLARNLFLSPRKTYSRKLTEAALAVRIERSWPKARILEVYLNQVYFGSGAYGVRSAARAYFGKSIVELDLAECALLAGLLRRPQEDPYRDRRQALARRNLVLERMASQGFITAAQARQATAEPIRLAGERRPPSLGYFRAPYFVAHVVSELERTYGEEFAASGLRVITTLDSRMQAAAEIAIRRGLGRARPARADDAALLCLDPHSGWVRAMVGGADFARDQWNCATRALRQPGSTFKPFVYLAALDRGLLSPETLLPARGSTRAAELAALAMPPEVEGPLQPGADAWGAPGAAMLVEGQEVHRRARLGWISVREAVVRSSNAAAVYTLLSVGPENVIECARQFGIRSPLLPYPSLALGAFEVTMLELAAAYGVLATGGDRAEPAAIRRIEDRRGRLIYRHVPRTSAVAVAPETLATVDGLLRDAVLAGTGRAAARVPGTRGKTGTTNGPMDAWFAGYTPDLVAAAWVGNRAGHPMRYGSGARFAAPIWAEFMAAAARHNPFAGRGPLWQSPEIDDEDAGEADGPLPDAGRDSERWGSETAAATGDLQSAALADAPGAPEAARGPVLLVAAAPMATPEAPPTTARVCLESFLRAGRHCPSTRRLRFDTATAPAEACHLHDRASSSSASERAGVLD